MLLRAVAMHYNYFKLIDSSKYIGCIRFSDSWKLKLLRKSKTRQWIRMIILETSNMIDIENFAIPDGKRNKSWSFINRQ